MTREGTAFADPAAPVRPGPTGPAPSRSTLAGVAARGAASTALGQLVRVGTQVLSMVILARLLTPEDFGYVAVVAVLIGLADVVRDAGLGTAAVQARTVSATQSNNLFYLTCCTGLVLAAVGWAGAGAVADLYGQPLLGPVIQAFAPVLLVNGIASQFRAHLYREFRYGRVAASDVVGQLAALVVGVTCALQGLGYWALVVAELARAVCTCAVLVLGSSWRPGRPGRAPMRGFYRVGGPAVLVQLINQTARGFDRLLVGWVFGAVAAGLYGRAAQLLTLPLNQVVGSACRVALPVLSRLQDSPQELSASVHRIHLLLANVTAGVLTFLTAAAQPVVEVVLGDQWSAAVPLVQVLCVAGIFQSLAEPAQWVLTATGRMARALTLTAFAGLLLVGALWVGSGHSVTATAIGYLCGQVLVLVASLLWLRATRTVPVTPLVAISCRAVVAHGAAGALTWLVVRTCQEVVHPVVAVVLGGASTVCALAVVVVAWPAFRRDASTALRAVRALR